LERLLTITHSLCNDSANYRLATVVPVYHGSSGRYASRYG
jgi:hypothetical protein